MNRKSIAERYADLSHSRMLETPRDKIEERYAEEEADQEAQRIWHKLQGTPQHRKRTIMRLAREILETDLGPEVIAGHIEQGEESLLK